MQNTLKKQNLSVIPRRLSASEMMDAEVKRGHLHPITCVPILQVTPREVGCKLFSGMCHKCLALQWSGGTALWQGEAGPLPARAWQEAGAGCRGDGSPATPPGPRTSSGTPSADAGAGCGAILGVPGVPGAAVQPWLQLWQELCALDPTTVSSKHPSIHWSHFRLLWFYLFHYAVMSLLRCSAN